MRSIQFETEEEDDEWEDPEESASPIGRYLAPSKCVYVKFKNEKCNSLYRTEYYAGLFCDRREFKGNKCSSGLIQPL